MHNHLTNQGETKMINTHKEVNSSILNFNKGRPIIFMAHTKQRLVEFKHDFLNDLLKKYGAIIFRGFEINLENFSDFIKKNSSRVTCDPARKASVENAQLIDAGTDAMGLHIENGNLPFLPDVQWFYCAKSPEIGSQTTICDGYDVWQQLADDTKNIFKNKRVTFTRNIPEHLWKKYLSVEIGIPYEAVNETHLKSVNRMVKGQNYSLNEDGSVLSEYKVFAAHPTKFSDKIAFANSIMSPSYNYEKPKITMEDGQPIPDTVMEEIKEVTEKLIIEIDWQENDTVVIDNSSVMHGRRKVDDPSRKIYGGQSYL